MNRYKVFVEIPSICKKYNIEIPNNFKLGQVIYAIINEINNFEGLNLSLDFFEVYNKYTGKIYNLYDYVYSLDICNNSSLIIIF